MNNVISINRSGKKLTKKQIALYMRAAEKKMSENNKSAFPIDLTKIWNPFDEFKKLKDSIDKFMKKSRSPFYLKVDGREVSEGVLFRERMDRLLSDIEKSLLDEDKMIEEQLAEQARQDHEDGI